MRHLYVLIFSLVIIVSSVSCAQNNDTQGSKVHTMQCEQFSTKQFESMLKALDRKNFFVPNKNDLKSVQFKFNLDTKQTNDALFVISSRAAKRFGKNNLIYVGPYKKILDIQIDSRLAKDKYYDDLKFNLFQLKKNSACGWVNSLSYPYWKPNNKITIDFLEEKRIDEEELVYMFDVNIR